MPNLLFPGLLGLGRRVITQASSVNSKEKENVGADELMKHFHFEKMEGFTVNFHFLV